MAERKTSLVLYWSRSGNTEKVARVIHDSLSRSGFESTLLRIEPDLDVDYFDYNLVFCGAPVYSFLPPEAVQEFLKKRRGRGEVLPGAPEKPGHIAVVFCTYGGGHTGFREAVPALKYMGQFFEHMGMRVVDEWAVVGEFREAGAGYNEGGRLGDITGRPSEQDLLDTRGKTMGLIRRLENTWGQ